MAAQGRYVPVAISRIIEVATGTQKPHRFVVPGSTANKVTQAGANAANVLGVLLPDLRKDEFEDGDSVAVCPMGVVYVEAGGAVNVGDEVGSDASGRAVVVDGTTITNAVGRALTAATQAGDIIEVKL